MRDPARITAIGVLVQAWSAFAWAETPALPTALKVPAIQAAYQTKVKLRRGVEEIADMTNDLDAITSRISKERAISRSETNDEKIAVLLNSTKELHAEVDPCVKTTNREE